MRHFLFALLAFAASPTLADQPDNRAIVETHVLPRYQALAAETSNLADSAAADCSPESGALIADYHDAFDAWVGVSHLRFGPSERDDRAFALAFWPDPRGATPKALAALIRNEDPIVATPDGFATVSVAARGFYALEFLLFDPQFAPEDGAVYHCRLMQALTVDIARTSAAILQGWEGGYGTLMSVPGNDTYRTSTEVARQFFTALSTGLEFASQTRLGRPMGTFDRPRPNRAEARRAGRSLRHISLSLTAMRELAALISGGDDALDDAFDAALRRAEGLHDPVFAGVATPQGRLKIEVLRQSIDSIRAVLAEEVGPSLGIAAGFNSLDGD